MKCSDRLYEMSAKLLLRYCIAGIFKTSIIIYGCTFTHNGSLQLIMNKIAAKKIRLKTFGNMEYAIIFLLPF